MASDLRELIERLEKLDGPSREVDLSIAELCGAGLEHTPAKNTGRIAWPGDTRCSPCPKFTGSFDAALALVERMFPGVFYHFAKGRCSSTEPLYAFALMFGSDEILSEAEHDCREIAILIATLRALSDQDTGQGEESGR